MYVLDTDHLGIIQRRTQPEFDRLWARIKQHPQTAFFTTIVSFHEQVLGWNVYLNRARDEAGAVKAYGMFQRILADFAAAQVFPYDSSAVAVFGTLRGQRVKVGTMDLRIASITLHRDMTLLTRNLADFRLVPGLRTEDWTV